MLLFNPELEKQLAELSLPILAAKTANFDYATGVASNDQCEVC
jgi:hypothetical protein